MTTELPSDDEIEEMVGYLEAFSSGPMRRAAKMLCDLLAARARRSKLEALGKAVLKVRVPGLSASAHQAHDSAAEQLDGLLELAESLGLLAPQPARKEGETNA